MPARREAASPEQFLEVLRDIESEAMAFHSFAPKVRHAGGRTDLAAWFETWRYGELAAQLDSFDPYLNSLEDTRTYLVDTIVAGLRPKAGGHA